MHLIVGSQVVEERICLVTDVHTLFCEHNQRNAMFHDDYASLSNVDERVTAEYVLPDKTRDTPYSEYLHSGEWETTGATLHYHRETPTLTCEQRQTWTTPDQQRTE